MSRLFSYVLEHDMGLSPNPFGDYCTLAYCKFSISGRRRNVVELAAKDDWVVGTGGASAKSAGHGKLVYAMRITEQILLEHYFSQKRFRLRADNDGKDANDPNRFALISDDLFYFGKNAVTIPMRFAKHPLEKKGPGFRSDFDEPFIAKFADWLRTSFRRGVHGEPCGGRPSHSLKDGSHASQRYRSAQATTATCRQR